MKNKYYNFLKIKFISLLIFFSCVSISNIFAQTKDISGIVLDENSDPLIGASILIQGTGKGVITDFDGNFALKDVESDAKLVVSYVGYKDQVVKVGSQNYFKILMKSDQEMLEEVVVIGYGSMKKRDVTGAITSVDSKVIEEKQPLSVFDALQGEAPGVLVISNSGAPGEESTVRVRGTSTFEAGVNPLYVVDGVQMEDITAINPNDIESMEILKDAASAAIYGSKSANGVVIITTKKGEKGKLKVSGRYSHSISTMPHTIPQANAFEANVFYNLVNMGLNKELELYVPFTEDPNNPTKNSNTFYQDELVRTAHTNQIDFSASSANETTSFYNSISYLDQQGIIINSWYKRLSAKSNFEFKPNEKLSFTTNLAYTYSKRNKINESQIFYYGLRRPAHFSIYNPDGSHLFINSGFTSPVAQALFRKNEPETQSILFNETVKYSFNKYLNVQASVNGNYAVTRTKTFMPSSLNKSGLSSATDITGIKRDYTAEFLLNYSREFLEKHSVNGILGTSVQDWYDESLNFAGKGHITESVSTVNAYEALDLLNTKSSAQSHSMASFFTRLSYSYMSRYMMNFTMRADGSSRFINNRWGYFPSLSLGWRFTDEKFLKPLKRILEDGKLRLSYGITGNERVGNYDSQIVYKFGGYLYNGMAGIRPSNMVGNPDLKWETTKQFNAGLDLTFGRFKAVLDYYYKYTDDLLYAMLLPTESGYDNMKANFGAVSNQGFEITVSGDVVRTADFKWNTGVNFSFNKNNIEKLATEDYVSGGGWLVAENNPIGQLYGYQALGVYAYDESNAYTEDFKTRLIPQFERDSYGNVIINSQGKPTLIGYTYPNGEVFEGTPSKMKYGNTVLKGGDIIWEEQTVDGVIDDDDRKVLGNGMPTCFFSWNNTFTWKDFSLNLNFYGSAGNKNYNALSRNLNAQGANNDIPYPYKIHNAWTYPGAMTDVPVFIKTRSTYNQNLGGVNSLYVEDASFIRLQTVRLSYMFKKKNFKWLPVSNMNLWVYANNLFTWTNYSGWDPEINVSNVLQPGNDTGMFPRSREFGIGLNVNF